MYIQKVTIQNIKNIDYFEMTFTEGQEAGWHVLIGDNGTGKTSIVRSIVIGHVDGIYVSALTPKWYGLLQKGKEKAIIYVNTVADEKNTSNGTFTRPERDQEVVIELEADMHTSRKFRTYANKQERETERFPKGYVRFSAAFGPYRRFTDGNDFWESLEKSTKEALPYITAFNEGVSLKAAINWLVELHNLERDGYEEGKLLEPIKMLLNNSKLLPNHVSIYKVDAKGVVLKDANGHEVDLLEMSDGFRSVLSMTFEVIRLMTVAYSQTKVLEALDTENTQINLPGVVLIDEVDAHLHPTWQTRIGQWFTRVFPKIQFIVTTHSPLICRAAEHGTIWKLATPGTNEISHEVTGTAKDRLVYGNVLDAYGTEVFGANVTQSATGLKKKQRMADLAKKSFKGVITDEERGELERLRSEMPTAK